MDKIILTLTFLKLVLSGKKKKDRERVKRTTKNYFIADKCELSKLSPSVKVDGEGEGDGDSWVGTFSCHSGSVLVGEQMLKCRNGIWSNNFPVCTGG